MGMGMGVSENRGTWGNTGVLAIGNIWRHIRISMMNSYMGHEYQRRSTAESF